jgi:hypothetical protein
MKTKAGEKGRTVLVLFTVCCIIVCISIAITMIVFSSGFVETTDNSTIVVSFDKYSIPVFQICLHGTEETGCEPVPIKFFRVVDCKSSREIWAFSYSVQRPLRKLDTVTYGIVPNGYLELSKPEKLSPGQCYLAMASHQRGSGRAEFRLGEVQSVE